jgi:hypothetical protein
MMPNTYRIGENYVEIDLRNRRGVVVGVTHIDRKDLEKVIKYRWCKDTAGYAAGRVNGKLVRLHKLICNYKIVDHIDRDKLNNRSVNLRPCTQRQNSHNQAGAPKTSLYKGVSRAKVDKWAVYAKFPNTAKRFWGYYVTELEAAKAYNRVAEIYGDEFTYLNALDTHPQT